MNSNGGRYNAAANECERMRKALLLPLKDTTSVRARRRRDLATRDRAARERGRGVTRSLRAGARGFLAAL